MLCPVCNGRSSVTKTLDACDVVFRSHACKDCLSTWVSEERIVPGSLRHRGAQEVARRVTEYGSNWHRIRAVILDRDGHRCTVCSSTEALHVHHIKRLLSFNGDTEAANRPENLTTLCPPCHLAEHGKGSRP